jgi:hypothetical protein
MKKSENTMAFSKAIALSAAAALVCGLLGCTDLSEKPVACGDGGCGGAIGDDDAGVDAGDAAPPEVVYSVVVISDISQATNAAGTAGVDICGVSAACGDGLFTGASAPLYSPGEGGICGDGNTPEDVCSSGIGRNDPAAALDDGAQCDAVARDTSAPGNLSCYVSVGVGGDLGIDFQQDLRGCGIAVVEHPGRDAEGYEVFICPLDADDEVDLANCLGDAPVHAVAAGGDASFDVPAAAPEEDID